MKRITVIAVLLALSAAMYATADPGPRLFLDCGSLWGDGKVIVVVGDDRHLFPIECPRKEAKF